MNGALFTLSGRLLLLTKFSCFFSFESPNQNITDRFSPYTSPLAFESTNIVKEKNHRLTSLFCFVEPGKVKHF